LFWKIRKGYIPLREYQMIFSNLKDLSIIVRGERKRQGLTQAETAALCQVGNRFLSDLENGKETVQFGKMIKVLNGLGLLIEVNPKVFREGSK